MFLEIERLQEDEKNRFLCILFLQGLQDYCSHLLFTSYAICYLSISSNVVTCGFALSHYS